ncbi:MAG: hypothetical protein E4H18_03795, partial [Hyphomicrobiales bacterium]
MMNSRLAGRIAVLVWTLAAATACADTGNAPMAADWASRIRPAHPRMFFTAESFAQVKAYVLQHEREYYERRIKNAVAALPLEPDADACERGKNKLYGPYAQMSAFVWLMEGDAEALAKARNYLVAGVDYYNRRSSARQTVNWYSASRVGAMTAYDWIYDQLTPADRKR